MQLHPEFREAYDQARERQVDRLLNLCLEVPDDRSGDEIDSTCVERAIIRVDALFKTAEQVASTIEGRC